MKFILQFKLLLFCFFCQAIFSAAHIDRQEVYLCDATDAPSKKIEKLDSAPKVESNGTAAVEPENQELKNAVKKLADDDKMSQAYLASCNNQAKRLKLLIHSKADVNEANESGFTPLHIAAKNGHNEIIKILLLAKADVDALNNMDQSPLHLATKNNQIMAAKSLLKARASTIIQDNLYQTPLYYAIELGNLDMVNTLLSSKRAQEIDNPYLIVECYNNNLYRPVHIGALAGNLEIVALLVQYGANINSGTGDLCQNVLHIAARKGHLKLATAVFEWLGIDSKDINGQTALHHAVINNQPAMAKMLLANGGSVSCNDKASHQPLYYAVKNGNKDLVILLLRSKANCMFISDKNGILDGTKLTDDIQKIIGTQKKAFIFKDGIFSLIEKKQYKKLRQQMSVVTMAIKENTCGNNPLHQAIINKDYYLFGLLIYVNPDLLLMENKYKLNPIALSAKLALNIKDSAPLSMLLNLAYGKKIDNKTACVVS